ncbi:hypothetical protein [Oleiagrimonas sp. MCCC 1A03011]|uniref:hypothetical protein n=1 Tax=Oleiagrimonas sp. MCCC 1A03011 TaxID=1926883 RepID=UPI000DC3FC9C|nr:hypothetical protein [Oleiagrimonas sp. MCCC 1A03011]RAP59426.1 hypothetical protein BTJ49_01835 [Oleiagrimonas sp. MCCC 1A03011]
MMKRFALATLACVALLAVSACTKAVLKPAPAISVPAGISQAQVKKSIVSALEGRKWTLDKIEDGTILSTLHLRDHTATIRITYNTQAVNITYLRSTNLEYSQRGSTRYIHRNYNGWINYLEQDITRNLQNLSATQSD